MLDIDKFINQISQSNHLNNDIKKIADKHQIMVKIKTI
jgi:hypothetical protein